MSEIKCPECGSKNILTERRPDGFHACLECLHRWKIGASQPMPTVFQKITASPEVLAEGCQSQTPPPENRRRASFAHKPGKMEKKRAGAFAPGQDGAGITRARQDYLRSKYE